MLVIEFFGLSGAGKTTIKNKLKKILLLKKINIYSYKQVILKFSETVIQLSIKEKIALNYFKFIKSSFTQKKKTNFKNTINLKQNKNKKTKRNLYLLRKFNLLYREICLRIFFKFKKENKKFVYFVFQLIKSSLYSNKEKTIIKNWFIEECAANYIADKNKSMIDIILDSEGFVQRSILYFYKNKNIKYNINKYFSLSPLPNLLFYIEKKFITKKEKKSNYFDIQDDIQKNIFDLIFNNLKKKKIKNSQKFKLIKILNKKKSLLSLLKIQKKLYKSNFLQNY